MGRFMGKMPYEENNSLKSISSGGADGIRTHETLLFTRFPSVRLKPLGHRSSQNTTATRLNGPNYSHLASLRKSINNYLSSAWLSRDRPIYKNNFLLQSRARLYDAATLHKMLLKLKG